MISYLKYFVNSLYTIKRIYLFHYVPCNSDFTEATAVYLRPSAGLLCLIQNDIYWFCYNLELLWSQLISDSKHIFTFLYLAFLDFIFCDFKSTVCARTV